MKSLINWMKDNFAFLIILFIQIMLLTLSMGLFKENYHSDELYAYGFANSYNSKDLEMDDFGNLNSNRWHDSKEMLEYLSVDKGEEFSFKIPFMHARMDLNPPFHLFLLHAISSFFPGVFSKWFGFIINIISFSIIQIFMYLIVASITKSKMSALVAIVLYGFGSGCFDTVMFLRMYALGTALAIMLLYFSYKLVNANDSKHFIHYLGLNFICLFLGAFTLHLYLVYAFPLVAVFCFTLLFKKKYKKMFAFGFTQLLAVGTSYVLFPKLISDTMSGMENYVYSDVRYSFAFQFRIYSYILTHDLFGIHFSMYSNPWIKNSIAVLIFVAFVISPFAFMSRKESWLINIFKSIKAFFIKLCEDIKNTYYVFIATIVIVLFTLIIVSWRTSVYKMSVLYTSRYIFMIYPITIIGVVYIVYFIFKNLIKRKNVYSCVLISLSVIFVFLSHLLSYRAFLFQYQDKAGITFSDLEDDANCILFLNSDWYILCFAPQIYNTDSYYYSDLINYMDNDGFLENIDSSKPCYLLMDVSSLITAEDEIELMDEDCNPITKVQKEGALKESEIVDYYCSFPQIDSLELVGNDFNFSGIVHIYKVNFADI